MYDLGLRLKELREKKNLSQAQVSRRLDLSNSSISGYESNAKTPSVHVLRQLALLYNVTTDYLLGLDDRRTLNIYGLTERQIDILNYLITEFKLKK